jgi:hypothetical protein
MNKQDDGLFRRPPNLSRWLKVHSSQEAFVLTILWLTDMTCCKPLSTDPALKLWGCGCYCGNVGTGTFPLRNTNPQQSKPEVVKRMEKRQSTSKMV